MEYEKAPRPASCSILGSQKPPRPASCPVLVFQKAPRRRSCPILEYKKVSRRRSGSILAYEKAPRPASCPILESQKATNARRARFWHPKKRHDRGGSNFGMPKSDPTGFSPFGQPQNRGPPPKRPFSGPGEAPEGAGTDIEVNSGKPTRGWLNLTTPGGWTIRRLGIGSQGSRDDREGREGWSLPVRWGAAPAEPGVGPT